MRDGLDKGTMILQCVWLKHAGKEHSEAGFLVRKVLLFPSPRSVRRKPSRAVLAAKALTAAGLHRKM